MNKIFKVIWSKSRNCYVVASELAKGTSKSTSTGRMAKRAALAAVAALLLFPVGGYSYAAGITIGTATINDSTGKQITVFTGDSKAASTVESTVEQTVPYNSKKIGELQDAMQSVETELAKHKNIINNLGTDKLTLSSDNTLQKESYDSTTKTTTTTNATGLKVAGPISAESGKITNSLEVGHNVNVGGAVNAGSVNSRGNLSVDGNALVKGTLTSQSTINGKEIVSQSNITAKNKVVGMHGVVDNTLTSGNYVTAGNTVGENIVALDTQVKANADAIGEEARKRKYSVTNLENADKQLQTNIDNEAAAREAADTALTNRIAAEETDRAEADTALQNAIEKEAADRKSADTTLQTNIDNEAAARKAADDALDSRTTALEDKTEAITYDKDSKTVMVDGKLTATEGITDGTTQNGQYVKADNYVGQNLNALDQGLQAETSARVAADTKLVKAVNNGLSLGEGNVLQKNTTTVAADGTVSTSKEAATTLVMNEGKTNQITLSENGIKVGLNSTVQDANGFYAGGDTADAAKAALNSDGSIKGAGGKFTVDTNGNVTSTGTVQGTTLTDGTASLSGGNLTGAHNITADGTITGNKLTDGVATLQNGNLNTTGNINAHDIVATGDISGRAITGTSLNTQGGAINGGAITGTSINGTTGTFGALTTTGNASVGGTLTSNGITNTGNTTTDSLKVNHNATVGGNLAVTGDITGKSLNVGTGSISGGQITGTGLDVGAGTIKTTGATETGTLKTTGKAEIGGDLSVAGNTEMKGNLDVKGDLSVEG